MRGLLKIAQGVEVAALRNALARKPMLWGAQPIRTTFKSSPHAEADDILVRFEDLKGIGTDDPEMEQKLEKAERIWQPAWAELPEIRPVVSQLMHAVGGYELMRILITRLGPGRVILPHADRRGAYANIADIARYHIVIQGLPGSVFHVENESVQMLSGEAWWFDARRVHSVQNGSADDRLHLLVDMRVM